MHEFEILQRLLLAAFLGGIIGLEREQARKTAGLRTHTLVAMSAALIAMTALYGLQAIGSGATVDSASRIIANILVGIGFIGGGAIIHYESRVSGLTTAASLWIVSAVGIAVGVGFTFAAIAVTLITYLILALLWKLEEKMIEGIENEEKGKHRARRPVA